MLVDTSVWIEYLRGSKGLVRDAFVRLLNDGNVGTTDAVLLEVLAGFTPRSLLHCVIAAVTTRHDVPLLHRDRDFDVIARHSDLRVLTP